MKKQTYIMIATMILAGLAAVSSASAQTGNSRLVASIPFEFHVGTKTLPAGEYSVKRINDALLIQSIGGSDGAMVQTWAVQSVEPQKSARLVFHRYGDQYFFNQAWTTAERQGMEAPNSRAERNVDSNRLARLNRTQEFVALAARR